MSGEKTPSFSNEENGMDTSQVPVVINRREAISQDMSDIERRMSRYLLQKEEFEAGSAYDTCFEDAPSPSYELMSGQEKLILRRDNTEVREYPSFPEFNHVQVSHRKDGVPVLRLIYIWQEKYPEYYERIKAQGFDVCQRNLPAKEDYDVWVSHGLHDLGLKLHKAS